MITTNKLAEFLHLHSSKSNEPKQRIIIIIARFFYFKTSRLIRTLTCEAKNKKFRKTRTPGWTERMDPDVQKTLIMHLALSFQKFWLLKCFSKTSCGGTFLMQRFSLRLKPKDLNGFLVLMYYFLCQTSTWTEGTMLVHLPQNPTETSWKPSVSTEKMLSQKTQTC